MARRSGTGGAAEECAVARARRPRLRRVEKFTRLLVAVKRRVRCAMVAPPDRYQAQG
jgi:hypothetical protein